MKPQSFRDLLIEQLRDLYNAEQQLTVALPKMAKAASSSRLREAFEGHLVETKQQVERLVQVFENLGKKPRGKTCKAMQGLIKEGEEVIGKSKEWAPDVVDAALIVAAQKIEHYEIAGYGAMRAFAEILGEKESADLLQETLEEEGKADKSLTEISSEINAEAADDMTEDELIVEKASVE